MTDRQTHDHGIYRESIARAVKTMPLLYAGIYSIPLLTIDIATFIYHTHKNYAVQSNKCAYALLKAQKRTSLSVSLHNFTQGCRGRWLSIESWDGGSEGKNVMYQES